MTEQNPFLKSIKESIGIRLAVLFGSFFVLLLISSVLGGMVGELHFGSERTHLLISSVIQNILAFCLPAFLLAKFCSSQPAHWLHLEKPLSLRPLLGVVIVYFLTLPAMEWLIEWNNNIHLPNSFKGLEETMRGWEEANAAISNKILDAGGFLQMISGVLIIGILTGFSEELFFRGGLQGIFVKGRVNKDLSVWLAAFVFSFMHFQFFGFLPRLLMGAFFGYLLIWSGDIKISAFAHILNNGMVVVVTYFFSEGSENATSLNLYPEFDYLPFISLGASVLFFILLRKYFFMQNSKPDVSWQKNQAPQVIEK